MPTEPGLGLSEITDPNFFPDFRDDYDKEPLLDSISNSMAYFKKIKSCPNAFNSPGFSPEKQAERSIYLFSKSISFGSPWFYWCACYFNAKYGN
ncbi:MAG: hypothetical protein ACE5GV_08225 [Candidatus Scalindua sp.]